MVRGHAAQRWRGANAERLSKCHDEEPAPAVDCEPIESFNGAYKFLSNFSWSKVQFEGATYPSVEHAFQAAKVKDRASRAAAGFTDESLSFREAKRLGRNVSLREDWRDIRESIMAACLESKFLEPALRAKLQATGHRDLIDGHWGSPDLVWGYHYPSRAGENRLGKLLMDLRSKLRKEDTAISTPPESCQISAVYHLDWPMKCLHDGLPWAYKEQICSIAADCGLGGLLLVLPKRRICIGLRGGAAAVDRWEERMTTESVDVNSRGKPCRERMLAQLLRGRPASPPGGREFVFTEAHSWADLSRRISAAIQLSEESVSAALGPEPPCLPTSVRYTPNREGVILDGTHFPLCLNDNHATWCEEPLLGDPDTQASCGPGLEVPLVYDGRPSIFGGRFARFLRAALRPEECQQLRELAEGAGFGLAGSRGFNPFARFALRCLVDAPLVASALTARLRGLLPDEYPAGSGQKLVGVNDRCRFLKYTPGMHHGGDHTDCAHEDGRGGRSLLTVQIYLNSDFAGGRTTFISNRLVPVEPAAGTVIVFDHELYHRGGQVTQGTKYAIRMDVLYSSQCPAEKQAFAPKARRVGQEACAPDGHGGSTCRRWGRR